MADIKKTVEINVKDKGVGKATKKIDRLNDVIDQNKSSTNSATKAGANYDRFMKGASQQSSNMTKNFSKQAQSMQGVLVPAYAEVAARVFALTAAYTALERAADYSILQRGQAAFAASTGKNMAQIAKSIQAASGHMLDFKEASTSAALASTAGLTTKNIIRMTKGARAASVALGRNMSDAMDRLTRGIVKAEPEILDEIGVIIRLDTVYKDFAKSVNKSTSELSEMEKLTARNAAIMGQLEGKFKDIAEQVPTNAFKELSTAVMDLGMSGAGVIASKLSGLVRVLADSEALLISIMALIGRSLLGKMFPFFTKLGDKLDNFTKKLSNLQTRLAAFNKKQLLKGQKDQLNKLAKQKESIYKELVTQAKSMGLLNGTLGGKAFAKEVKAGALQAGKELSKGALKGLTMATKLSLGKIRDGKAAAGTAGMMGMSKKELMALEGILGRLNKTITGIGKATKGTFSVEMLGLVSGLKTGFAKMGVSATTALTSIIDGFRAARVAMQEDELPLKTKLRMFTKQGSKEVLDYYQKQLDTAKGFKQDIADAEAGMGDREKAKWRAEQGGRIRELKKEIKDYSSLVKKLGKVHNSVIARMGAGMGMVVHGLSKGLNSLVMILGSFTMLKWVAEEFLGWSKAAKAAHDAVDALNDSLDQTSKILGKRQKLGKSKDNIAETLAGSLDFRKQKFNLAEQLSLALEEAAGVIDIKRIEDSWYASFIDGLFSAVGEGIADKMNDSISKALTGMAGALDGKMFEDAMAQMNLEQRLSTAFETSQTDSTMASGLWAASGAGLLGIGGWLTGIASAAAAAETSMALLGISLSTTLVSFTGIGIALGGLYVLLTNGSRMWDSWGQTATQKAKEVVDTLRDVNAGILSPEMANEEIQDKFNLSKKEAISLLRTITKIQKDQTAELEKQRNLTQEMFDNIAKLTDQRKSLVNSLFPSSDVKEFSDTYQALIKNLQDPAQNPAEKFMLLKEQGLFGENNKALLKLIDDEEFAQYQELMKHLKSGGTMTEPLQRSINALAEKSLLVQIERAKGIITDEEARIKDLHKGITGDGSAPTSERLAILEASATDRKIKAEQDLFTLREKAYNLVKKGRTEEQLVIEFNKVNARKMYENELTYATQIAAFKFKISEYDKFGVSAVKTKALYQQAILEIEKESLQQKIKLGDFEEGTAEYNNAVEQINILTAKIKQAGKTAVQEGQHINQMFGTLYKLSDQISDKLDDSVMGNTIDFKKWKADTITKEFFKFKNALDETFKDTEQVAFNLDMLKVKFGSLGEEAEKALKGSFMKKFRLAFPDEKEYKNIAKWVKLATTAQGKEITSRHEVLNEEKNFIDTQKSHFHEHEDLLALRKKMADWDDKISDASLTREKEKLKLKEIQTELAKTELALMKSEWKEITDWLGGAMVGVADSFGDAISGSMADIFMNKKADKDWIDNLREDIAQGFATSAGDIIGNIAQKTVFGNQGWLASAAEGLGVAPEVVDTMFPRDDVEILRDKLEELRQLEEKTKTATEELVRITQAKSQGLNLGTGLDKRSEKLTQMLSGGWGENIRFVGRYSLDELHGVTPFKSVEGAKDNWNAGIAEFVKVQKEANSDLYNNPDKYFKNLEDLTLRYVQSISRDGITYGAHILNDTDIETTNVSSILHEVLHKSIVIPFKEFSNYFKGLKDTKSVTAFDSLMRVEKKKLTTREKKLSPEVQKGMLNVGRSALYRTHEGMIEEFFVRLKTMYAYMEAPETREGQVQLAKDLIPDYLENEMTPGFVKELVESVVDKEGTKVAKLSQTILDGASKELGVLVKIKDLLSSIFQKLGFGDEDKKDKINHDIAPSNNPHFDPDFENKQTAKQLKWYDEWKQGVENEKIISKHHGEKGTLKRGLLGDKVYQSKDIMPTGKRIVKEIYDDIDKLKNLDYSKVTQFFDDILKFVRGTKLDFVTGMSPKSLTDSTLSGMGYLGPGQIGPKTEAQTFFESLQEGGSLKVLEQNPDAQKDSYNASGGILVQNPSSDNTAENVSKDLRGAMASNLHSQIMNDNMNARSLITNSVAQVGTNIMSDAVGGIIGSFFGFANGGIAKGGFRAFANGGTVNQPTLGLVGEGKYNEAVVPLPDGKSIPVMGGTGGNVNNVTVNVTVDSDGNAKAGVEQMDSNQQGKELGHLISQVVQEQIMLQQRPGGLLNSY